MGSSVAEAQVGKKCYKNQTAGWQGVVKLDHLGAQVGFSVPPLQNVWLTDDEALLTARAPQRAEDNPFVEQPFLFQDQEGNRVEQMMAPLVLVENEREVPGDGRYVPGLSEEVTPSADLNLQAVAAGQIDTEARLAAESDRPLGGPPSGAVPATQAGTGVHPSHALPEEAPAEESWVENPDRTEEPQQGNLSGSNEQVGPDDSDPAKTGSPQGAPPQQPIPQGAQSAQRSGAQVVPSESAGTAQAAGAPSEQGGEEHAGVTRTGEETGAADQPTGAAPEGEFAQHEEVGSPDAPSREGEGE